MNAHVVAIISIVAVGVLTMVGYRVWDESVLTAATDSANIKHTINIGVDNWAGYAILCSKETRRIALNEGILVKCHDDGADYDARMSRLLEGELEMAAATVDGYVLAGQHYDYPGSFEFVIDESQGGDVIVANRAIAENTDDLKGRQGLRIAFTRNSPSETLVTAWSRHFDVPINNPQHFTIVEANGSSDAAKKLLNNEVDVAVVWEPDASRILTNANFIKLLGSESTKNLIVDALVANQRYATSNPDVIQKVTEAYFIALEYYKARPEEFKEAIGSYTGLKDGDQIESVMAGINFVDLPHNGLDWLGMDHNNLRAQRQLYDTIEAARRLFEDTGLLSGNPLPGNDPFRIINTTAFAKTFQRGMDGELGVLFQSLNRVVDTSVTREFEKLSPGRWARLGEIGSLRLEPITFRTGTPELYLTNQESFRSLIEMLETYPNYRLKVVGHTGWTRNETDETKVANMDLSKARANAAAKHLMNEYGIHKNRIYTLGLGSSEPPKREAGESNRAWHARWPRVELVLVEGS